MNDPRKGKPSASGIAKLAACPGSLRLCAGLHDRPTDESSFGTRVHEALAGRLPLEDIAAQEADIAESCMDIEAKVFKQWLLRIEAPVDAKVTTFRDTERLWIGNLVSGVADVIHIWGDCALILDFKSLPGDHESAESNMQLRCLAVLAKERWRNIKRIDAAIIQPLVTHEPDVCSYDERSLSVAKLELLSILHSADSPHAPLITGDHCKFCRANAICPETRREVTTLSQMTIHDSGPLTVSDEDLAAVRGMCGRAVKMIASIKSECERRAAANPERWRNLGWEMSEPTGKRAVSDVATVSERLNAKGATWEDITGACTITIGNVEALARKATGAKGVGLKSEVDAILADCVTLKTAKPTLKRIGRSIEDEE